MTYHKNITDKNWTIQLIGQAKKFDLNLPKNAQLRLIALIRSLSKMGPIKHEWPHYGKLAGKKECYHCHIERGRPTYVACWQVVDKKQKIIEVYYAGTHEKAPY